MTLGHWAVRWVLGVAIIGAFLHATVAPVAAQSDPPALVARLARISGIVAVRDAGEERWRVARLNLPLPPGDAVSVEAGGQAVLDIAASRIGLEGGAELRLDVLGDQAVEATLARGEIYLRLRDGAAPMRINTPRGVVQLTGDGRYAIAAGDGARPTIVTVLEGSARLDIAGAATTLTANQGASITGNGPFSVATARARSSAFTVAMMAQDPRVADATPELVRQMTGVGDLAQYGDWRTEGELGAVWVPRVEAGWVPYRQGVWAWVEPWGWTWVDDAPWGFAPFHYGRWTEIGPREDRAWAWEPAPLHAGVGIRPAYAPALVRFVGMRRTEGQTVAPQRGTMAVLGWTPLAPGEVYRPGFATSPEFRRRLNVNYARNTDAPVEAAAPGNLAAATLVPAWAMIDARPAQRASTRLPPLPPHVLEPLAAADLPGPSLATLGMTPATAARMGLVGRGPAREQRLILPTPLPPLRAAGGGNRPLAGGVAPGPEIAPAYPGLRPVPGPASATPGLPRR